MDNILEFLGTYGSNLRYEDLPAGTVHKVKRLVIDTLGCAIGSYNMEPPRIAREHALEVTSVNGATVLGTRHRSSPEHAAFANAVMARYFDMNDTSMSAKSGHTSDCIPAVLAAAEYAGCDMHNTIAATVLAYEIHDRFGAVCGDVRVNGWDYVIYTSLASAGGAAKAMRLNKQQIAHALAIATIPNAAMNQTRAGNLSMWKGCAGPNAGRNGLFAALLAKRGLTGPDQAFEGTRGFKRMLGASFELPPFGGGDVPYSIETAKFKCFPCDYEAQCSITPALELHRKLDGQIDQIAKVEVETYEFAIEIAADTADKWNPATRETADHSIPYVVAVALVKGAVWLDDFTEERIGDPQVRALMQKIQVRAAEDCTRAWPDAYPFRITVTTTSGEQHVSAVHYAKGHPKNPLTDQEVEAKFRRLAEPVLGPGKASKVVNELWKLESIKDVRELLQLFALD